MGHRGPVLVTLGADPGALSAVRLTRLPQARRGDRVQRLLYLNPAPDATPIIRMQNGRSHLTPAPIPQRRGETEAGSGREGGCHG